MKTKVLIIGDTHISSFKDLPKKSLQYIKESDWVIHVGDYTSKNIFEGFNQLKANYFKGVYGNSDPLAIRKLLPPKIVIEISGISIGIIHPESGGSETFLEKRIIKEFRAHHVDVIAYGHSHEAKIQWVDKTLLVNPGRGYIDEFSYNPPASIAIITIDKEIKAEIKEIIY
ncbi:MAG: YfcE family phosphodiesterase [Candidatus Lokiarchaeota archaeon]|nr:YfcE family phosphodiesterase [Candidatus Lokiarchaeota archaeon]